MTEDQWTAVDRYFGDALHPSDEALDGAIAASEAAGLPAIAVAPNQGRLLELLARMVGARRILEIGTLGGYSTIWMARALAPGGTVVTIEASPKHAEVARLNIEHAGLSDRVDIRIGTGLDVLPRLASEAGAPFDLAFIDADKANIPAYFDWAVRMARRGSLIIVDNVVRKGAVIDADSTDPDVIGVRKFRDMLADDSRVSATAIQTVGVKGYDGLALALVMVDP